MKQTYEGIGVAGIPACCEAREGLRTAGELGWCAGRAGSGGKGVRPFSSATNINYYSGFEIVVK